MLAHLERKEGMVTSTTDARHSQYETICLLKEEERDLQYFFSIFFKNNLSSLSKPSLHICHGENEGRQWESAEVGPSLLPATTALRSSGCRPPTNPPSALAADCEQWLVLAVALMIVIVFRLWSWSLLLAMPGFRERLITLPFPNNTFYSTPSTEGCGS